MAKNQLFKTPPTEDICALVLGAFGLDSIEDTTNFSKKDLEVIGTVDKLYELKQQLEFFYIPCKARTYLNDLSSKNCITVLRQILKVFGRTVASREKYIKGQKYVVYQIIPTEYKKYQPISIKSTEGTSYLISFE